MPVSIIMWLPFRAHLGGFSVLIKRQLGKLKIRLPSCCSLQTLKLDNDKGRPFDLIISQGV